MEELITATLRGGDVALHLEIDGIDIPRKFAFAVRMEPDNFTRMVDGYIAIISREVTDPKDLYSSIVIRIAGAMPTRAHASIITVA